MNIDICTAILALDSNARVSVIEEDYNKITWSDENPNNITIDQIKAKQAELKADYDAKEYQRKRVLEYPTIEECVHAILDDELDELQVKRKTVKDKYPK
jgi:homoaconitase/3-isopropylmalate dehydratase large subunit